VNVKKRALHLGVTVGLVGSLVAVAAPAAHAAAAPLPDTCAVYIQGPIDPTGGVLPNAIPLNSGNPYIFYAVGHDTKGQNKTVVDVNNAAVGATRFSYGVSMTNLNGGAAIALKYQWKNGTAATIHTEPTVQVKGASTIAKGVLSGVSGQDNFGAQIGNLTQVPPAYNLVVPNAATGGTYTISFTIPANALGAGVPPVAIPFNIPTPYNAGHVAIQGALNAALGSISASATVTGTDFVAGTTDGNYTITLGGSLAGGAPIVTIATPQTGTLATTLVDDGSLWNGSRFGGTDPGIAPVSILPQGIISVNGVMSNGPVATPGGKAQYAPDTQVTALGFPAILVTTVAPRLGTADAGIVATTGALAGLVGAPIGAVNDPCGLGGLLALFCTAESSLIPASFAGLCPSILN